MKKIIVFVLIAVIACFAAFAENENANETYVNMAGVVTELTGEGGYIIESAEYGQVQVNIGEETFIETSRDIAAGDYIYVDFNGMMTRSIPAQVTAQAVRMYVIEGEIAEAYAEENAALISTEAHGEVYVTLPEEWKDAEIDFEYMTVYFDGAMTMSLPPRVNAARIVPGYGLQGAITEIAGGYIVIGDGAQAVQVNTEGAEVPEGMETGDVVRVIYDGMMTRSIPAQINADRIIQISK